MHAATELHRTEPLQTGPVEIRIVTGGWEHHPEPAIAVEVDDAPLTPEDARLLAVRLVRLADEIDRTRP